MERYEIFNHSVDFFDTNETTVFMGQFRDLGAFKFKHF